MSDFDRFSPGSPRFRLVIYLAAIAFLGSALLVYSPLERYQNYGLRIKSRERREKLAKSIQLRRWWLVPNDSEPKEIRVELNIERSGRLAANAQLKGIKGFGHTLFASWDPRQRRIQPGVHLLILPLTRYEIGQPDEIELSIFLFDGSPTATTEDDIVIKYLSREPLDDVRPEIERQLPPPVQPTE